MLLIVYCRGVWDQDWNRLCVCVCVCVCVWLCVRVSVCVSVWKREREFACCDRQSCESCSKKPLDLDYWSVKKILSNDTWFMPSFLQQANNFVTTVMYELAVNNTVTTRTEQMWKERKKERKMHLGITDDILQCFPQLYCTAIPWGSLPWQLSDGESTGLMSGSPRVWREGGGVCVCVCV